MKWALALVSLAGCCTATAQDVTKTQLTVGMGIAEEVSLRTTAKPEWRVADMEADADGTIWAIAAALRVQGPVALPQLKKSLQTAEAGSPFHWWLAAIIQAIERSR